VSRSNKPAAHAATLVGAALLFCACGEDPVAPPERAASPPNASMSLESLAEPLDLAPDISAMTARLVPSIEDDRVAADLRGALARLSAEASRGDMAGARAALSSARSVLRDGVASPADLDAMRLTLAAIEDALTATPDK
jgi:hypothetical protein